MKKVRLYQAKAGDIIKWMGRAYTIMLKDKKILLRPDELKWRIAAEFGENCKMWVELVMRKHPETVGELVM